MKSLWARFWEKVEKTDSCWLFRGAKIRDGYGSIYTGPKPGQTALVHRLSYCWLVGPIPDGLILDHLCRNRACVNPDHLEPVTIAENNRRGLAGASARNGSTCRNGLHPWPESAEIRSDGWRGCHACYRARIARRHAKDRAARRERQPAEVVS